MEDPFSNYFNNYRKDKSEDLGAQGLPSRLKNLEKEIASIDAELNAFNGKDGLSSNTDRAFLSAKDEAYYNKLISEREVITQEIRHVQGDIFITKTDRRN